MQHSPVLQRLLVASVVATRSGAFSPALVATKQHGVRELLQGGRCSEGPATVGAVERGSCCSPSTIAASHVTTTVRRWPKSGAAMEHRRGRGGGTTSVLALELLLRYTVLPWSSNGASPETSVMRCSFAVLRSDAMKLQWSIAGDRHAAYDGRRGASCNVAAAAYCDRRCPPTCSIVIVTWARDGTDCGRRCTHRGRSIAAAARSPAWVRRRVRRCCSRRFLCIIIVAVRRRVSQQRRGAAGCKTRGEGRRGLSCYDRTGHMRLIGRFARRMISRQKPIV